MRRIHGLARPGPGPWDWFLVALLFLLIFPLFPIGAEALFTQRVNLSSLTLVTSTYAISLAISSRSLLVWAFGFVVGFLFAVMFGWTMGVGDEVIGPAWSHPAAIPASPPLLWMTGVGISSTFMLHLFERYTRHVVDRHPFPEFLKEA